MGRNVLITGTTSGIGQALALEFARNGYDLILVSRDRDKLEAQQLDLSARCGVAVQVIALDLIRQSAADDLADQLRETDTEVDILVHNAGFYEVGEFAHTDGERELNMIQLHITFITRFTKLILPRMLERGTGKIMLLGSIASFVPGPLNLVYCASKAYVLRFGEGLAAELRGSGVQVTVVCPGPVATPFARKANFGHSRLFSEHLLTADQVARAGYRALVRGKSVVVVGGRNKLLRLGAWLVPAQLTAWVVKRQMQA
jgi:short-subunit dehydrogenase